MDISFIVVLWVIISIIQAVVERKKAPPPPELPPQDLDFEIPTLANDPAAEVEEIDLAELYRQRKIENQKSENAVAAKVQSETEFKPVEENKLELDLTPAAVMNSIIMNEILDKPKALRRKKF